MKKFALFAILAIALALIVAACGPAATPPPTAAPAQPTAAPAQPTAAPAQPTAAPAQPTAAPAQPTAAPAEPTAAPTTAPAATGPKVLRIGRSTFPENLDPQKASFGIEIEVLKLVYEGLLSLDNKGNIGPGAADKWDKSPDGLKTTFHIRDGLKRSDGTPITAKDYEYSLKRIVDPCIAGKQYTSIMYDVKGAQALDDYGNELGNDCTKADTAKMDALWADYGVKALDDSNLEVTFKQPTGFWDYIAYTWVTYPTDPRAVEKDPDTWWLNPENHIGNGPFKIQTFEEGKKIVYVPNENYWRGKPKLDRIEAIYNTDNAVIFEAYKNGELDINANIAPEQFSAIDADPVLKDAFLRYPAAITTAIAFNNTRKPFDDINVRKAFSAGFDREAWIRDVSKGLGGPYTRWIPPGVPGSQPDKIGVPPYDPVAAVKYLTDNGYAAADSTAEKPKVDCAKLGDLKLTYAATPLNHARFQFIAGNYVKVFGCPITLDPVDATVLTALTKDVKTNPQISRQGWIQDYPHPQNWLSVYWVCGAFSSRYGYCNPKLDEQLKKADTTLNFEEAIKEYQAGEDILMGDVPAAFSNYTENVYMVAPWVVGPKDYPSSSDAEWAGEWGPVWEYDIDLTKVPATYPKE